MNDAALDGKLDIDFGSHPHYREDNPCAADYGNAIGRLQWTPREADRDEETVLGEARAMLARYTFRNCRETFGRGAPFSLMKEMYCDVLACNAAVIARSLLRHAGDDAAVSFLTNLYAEGAREGFDRDHEFLLNRLDSRTFVPLRRLIAAAYLRRAGFSRLDNVLLCVGDCQTMQLAEWVRYLLPLNGLDMFAYQHSLRTLVTSGLADLIRPAGYFFFVNTGIQYGGLKDAEGKRDQLLDELRYIVDWLQQQRPAMSVFVTHAFCGIDQAVKLGGIPRERAIDAATTFADDAAAILARAPGARLVKLTDVCPFCLDASPFRDRTTGPLIQHYHFPIMARVAKLVARELRDLTPRPAACR